MNIKYHPDIDGLRAVAVIAVIIYHANFTINNISIFPGGYIGVDIFFVISGYLITSIILRDYNQGSFRFSTFYEKRIRRLIPAYLTVMIVCMPLAWILMLPKAMTEHSASALSSLIFSSNFWFLQEDSYVAEASALKPLLHTWSLAIEEQFYLIFPALFIITLKYVQKASAITFLLLFLISLSAAIYASTKLPDANFYLLPFRAWELFSGVLLALFEINHKVKLGITMRRLVCSAAGIGLILTFTLLDNSYKHPALITLLPVFFTILLIRYFYTNNTVLTFKPLVYIGLISYSLYLWHFPIFAFSKIANIPDSNLFKLIQITLSFLFASISYKLIEKPFRDKQKIKGRYLKISITITLICVASFHIYSYKSNGLPQRFDQLNGTFDEIYPKWMTGLNNTRCHNQNYEDTKEACSLNIQSDNKLILLVGDSKALSIQSSLFKTSKERNYKFGSAINTSCTFLIDKEIYVDGKPRHRCNMVNQSTQELLLDSPPAIIIYQARWAAYEDHDMRFKSDSDLISAYFNTFEKLIHKDHKLILVMPMHEFPSSLPEFIKNSISGMPKSLQYLSVLNLDTSVSKKTEIKRLEEYIYLLKKLKSKYNDSVILFDPMSTFCNEQTDRCETKLEGKLLLRDVHHLTPFGIEMFSLSLVKFIDNSKLFNQWIQHKT